MRKLYKNEPKITIVLLECEVDIILQALADFNHGVNKKYNFRKKSITESEESDKIIARNVYEHIFINKVKLIEEKEKREKIAWKIIDKSKNIC